LYVLVFEMLVLQHIFLFKLLTCKHLISALKIIEIFFCEIGVILPNLVMDNHMETKCVFLTNYMVESINFRV